MYKKITESKVEIFQKKEAPEVIIFDGSGTIPYLGALNFSFQKHVYNGESDKMSVAKVLWIHDMTTATRCQFLCSHDTTPATGCQFLCSHDTTPATRCQFLCSHDSPPSPRYAFMDSHDSTPVINSAFMDLYKVNDPIKCSSDFSLLLHKTIIHTTIK